MSTTACFLLALGVTFCLPVGALRWLHTSSDATRLPAIASPSPGADVRASIATIGLSDADEHAFFRSVSARARKPDCFRSAAAQLHARCADLELDEGARVRGAITMTLCELQTAQYHSTPMECAPFAGGVAAAELVDVPFAPCVDAISRSAQFWASYSGYLRDIPQLCLAYQKANEQDTARELYRNATLEKVALLRYMNYHLQHDQEMVLHWNTLLSESQDAIRGLRSVSSAMDGVAIEVNRKASAALAEAIVEFQAGIRESQRQQSTAATQHADALSLLAPSIEQSVVARLESVYDRIDAREMQVLEYTNEVWARYARMDAGLRASTESLDSLTAAAALLTQHLNSTSEISRQIRSSQGSAARSTANLAETLQMLTLTAHGALDDLNDTAFAMKGALSTGYGGSWGSVLGAVDGNSWTIFLSPCGGLDMPLITKDLLTGFFLVARLGELLARMAAGYLWGLLWFLIRQAMLSPVLAAMFLASFSVTRQPRTAAHPHQPPLAVYAPARCHGPCAHQLHGTNFAWRRPARFSRIPPPDRIGRPPGFYDGAVGS